MSEQNIEHTFDNIFYDYYEELTIHYTDYITELWPESRTVCLADTPAEIGLFAHSDIIAVYGEDGRPSVITERIWRKNYYDDSLKSVFSKGWRQWRHINHMLNEKVKYVGQELGYNIKVTKGRDYIDYIHYKEEWWEWARRLKASSQ